MLSRRADRRLQPVGAAGRLGRRGAARARRRPTDGGYRINGSKAWITHGGRADFYTLFARTGEGSRGISCFLVPGDLPGLSFGKPEEKMGLHAVPDHLRALRRRLRRRRPAHRRGGPGSARSRSAHWIPAGSGSPRWRSGSRRPRSTRPSPTPTSEPTFGRKIIDHQGLGFLLADMAAAVDSAPAPPTSTPPAAATPGCPIRSRPASPSSSPPTPR